MDEKKNFRVLKFYGQNVMGMKVFAVDLDPNVVEVCGPNGAGKSSFMAGLPMLIGGKKAMPEMPLRSGETEGFIGCVLDNGIETDRLLVKRRIDGKKPELEIRSAGGFVAPEPQTLLNAFKNDLSFDPGKFANAESKKQVEMVRKLVGLDFSELDAQRKSLYDERTLANKRADTLKAQAAGVVVPEGTPAEPVSVEALMAEQKNVAEFNKGNQRERDKIKDLTRDVDAANKEVTRINKDIADLEAKLAKLRSELEAATNTVTHAQTLLTAQNQTVAVLQDKDVEAVQKQIVDSQRVNQNVAEAKRKQQLEAAALAAAKESDALTAKIEAIDQRKTKELAEAKWPIPGMSINDEHGVVCDGIPISQVNAEKRLRIGIAVCAAMNPELVAIRIENASLMDEHQLAAAKEEAKRLDLQLWLEVVSVNPPDKEDAEIIFIADGAVVSGKVCEAPAAAPKPKRTRKSKTAEAPPPVAEDQAFDAPMQPSLFEEDDEAF